MYLHGWLETWFDLFRITLTGTYKHIHNQALTTASK